MVAGVAVAEINLLPFQDKPAVIGQISLAVRPIVTAIRTAAYGDPLSQVLLVCIVKNVAGGVVKPTFGFGHQIGAGVGAEGAVCWALLGGSLGLLTAGKGQGQ